MKFRPFGMSAGPTDQLETAYQHRGPTDGGAVLAHTNEGRENLNPWPFTERSPAWSCLLMRKGECGGISPTCTRSRRSYPIDQHLCAASPPSRCNKKGMDRVRRCPCP